jgi:pyruvate/2-oxoglutarate dehydrogenase complex dihydrolipoamide dehydrogenase (E3) component
VTVDDSMHVLDGWLYACGDITGGTCSPTWASTRRGWRGT